MPLGPIGALVGMRPWTPIVLDLLCWQRHSKVASIERDRDLVGTPKLLEEINYLGFELGVPDELRVSKGILAVETTMVMPRQVLHVPCRRIVALVAQVEALKPSLGRLCILGGLLLGHDILDYYETVPIEILQPLRVVLCALEGNNRTRLIDVDRRAGKGSLLLEYDHDSLQIA